MFCTSNQHTEKFHPRYCIFLYHIFVPAHRTTSSTHILGTWISPQSLRLWIPGEHEKSRGEKPCRTTALCKSAFSSRRLVGELLVSNISVAGFESQVQFLTSTAKPWSPWDGSSDWVPASLRAHSDCILSSQS